MPLDFEKRWQAYKEVVLDSQDKSLELFATKKVGDQVHIHLNQQASTSDANTPVRHDELCVDPEPELYDTTMNQPPTTQTVCPVGITNMMVMSRTWRVTSRPRYHVFCELRS